MEIFITTVWVSLAVLITVSFWAAIFDYAFKGSDAKFIDKRTKKNSTKK